MPYRYVSSLSILKSHLISLPLFSCSFFCYIEPRNICPPSHTLAEAVPGNEEEYPYISYWSVIRNQSKGPICGVGMVEALFENKPIRSFGIVYGGWNLLQTLHASLLATWPHHSSLCCVPIRLRSYLLTYLITMVLSTSDYAGGKQSEQPEQADSQVL